MTWLLQKRQNVTHEGPIFKDSGQTYFSSYVVTPNRSNTRPECLKTQTKDYFAYDKNAQRKACKFSTNATENAIIKQVKSESLLLVSPAIKPNHSNILYAHKKCSEDNAKQNCRYTVAEHEWGKNPLSRAHNLWIRISWQLSKELYPEKNKLFKDTI